MACGGRLGNAARGYADDRAGPGAADDAFAPATGPRCDEQVLAANVDVLFIVCGLDRDYNPRRLERYLVLAHDCGARPVIVLNKADLADELGFDLEEVVTRTRVLAEEATVLTLSALTDCSLDALAADLAPSQTAAMIGSSGAGKSTILNRLLGIGRQKDGCSKGWR